MRIFLFDQDILRKSPLSPRREGGLLKYELLIGNIYLVKDKS